HAAEQLGDLERAADTPGSELAWRAGIDALAAQEDLPAAGHQVAGEQVDRRGLAGAVRTDQAHQLALPHDKIEVAHGDDAAEALAEVTCFDQGCGHGRGGRPYGQCTSRSSVGPTGKAHAYTSARSRRLLPWPAASARRLGWSCSSI